MFDLHMHSAYSTDGQFEIIELLELCKKAGLKVVALTDHNSVKGVEQMLKHAPQFGIEAISGVEIDCVIDDVELHVLGYNFDYNDPRFSELENFVLQQEKNSSALRLEKVKEMGIDFNYDEVMALSKNGIVTPEAIAESAFNIDRGLPANKRNPLLDPLYATDSPLVEFYWQYCTKGKPAYVPINFISLKDAVNLIHSAGGFSILAHPAKNIAQNESLLNKIIDCGVKGIEVYSNYHTKADTNFYLQYAKQKGLMITRGSDFHGKTKPKIMLGHFGN